MNTLEHQRLLTITEAADRLNVSPVTVRRLIRGGRFPAIQLGGKRHAIRVPAAELDQWVNQGGDTS